MQLWPNKMHASSTAGLSGLLSVGVVPRWTVPATSGALRSGPSSLLGNAGNLYGCSELPWARVLPRRSELPGHGRRLSCAHSSWSSSVKVKA